MTTVDRWTRLEQLVPPYPPALFDLLADIGALSPTSLVVDLGAGTGRAALPLARNGWRVIAVDTDSDALAGLTARAAALGCDVGVVTAPAEATGLEAGAADLVVAAQSFHWFQPGPALAEMARITRSGGVVAPFWMMREPGAPGLPAAHRELLARYEVDPQLFLEAQIAADAAGPALDAAAGFEDVRRHDITHPWTRSIDDAMELGTMPGYIRSLAPDRQEHFRRDLAQLLERFADPVSHTITETYRTTCWTARRSIT